jgi:hypothetical protein
MQSFGSASSSDREEISPVAVSPFPILAAAAVTASVEQTFAGWLLAIVQIAAVHTFAEPTTDFAIGLDGSLSESSICARVFPGQQVGP